MSLVIQDLDTPVATSIDVAELRALLEILVGQPVFDLCFVYPDELTLHLGQEVPYGTDKLSRQSRGSFVLGTSASGWRLNLSDPPSLVTRTVPAGDVETEWLTNQEKRDLERRGESLRGRTVATLDLRIEPESAEGSTCIGLRLGFAGGSSFSILPTPDPNEPPDGIPDWELLTPFGHHLQVGPGLRWSYLPSMSRNTSTPPNPPTP